MKLTLTTSKEKSAMRKLTSFAAIGALALLMTLCSVGNSFAQLFNYDPYPVISINQEDYYPDAQYLVPDALPGGERYFLVPIFIFNGVDPSRNPNTLTGLPPGPGGRIPGVDGQFLEPIRSFEFQVRYANQAIVLDQNPAHGSPIMTVGPNKSSQTENSLAAPFYIRYTEQSANDSTNPFNRLVRVTAASEVPLPQTIPLVVDSSTILCYLRFKILPNWTVNATLLQLDSAKFADHVGDVQYDPNNFQRGNLGGHKDQVRGRIPVVITAQPAFEPRPFSIFSSTDNKNYDLLPTMIYDPTNQAASNTLISYQLRNSVGLTRLTNVNICTDETWLKVGLTAGGTQHCIFIPRIDFPSSLGSQEFNIFIQCDPAGLTPGVYYGYITMTSEGASNSPARIKVTFIVRARPNEPTAGAGTGIRLSLTNSCSPTCTSNLVFGTGPGASDGVDLLYGEDLFTVGQRSAAQAATDPANRCYAYFESLNPNADTAFQNPNNLGTKRDIRSEKTDSTLLYKVTFGTGGPLCYPLSVCFDPTDLPEGSRFIIRDILNGSGFSFNMREATQVGNNRCVVIRDANITSFIIEYTPGSKGQTAALMPQNWNFISLPVNPSNMKSSVIFPNSTGTPFSYASNAGWTPAIDMEFGRGYMIHYGSQIGTDNVVSGVRSKSISNVRVHAGWNSVGAPSFPTCITTPDNSPNPTVFTTPVLSSNPKIQTDFFEFVPTHGYNTVAYLLPGHGYFVKVSDEGNYNVHVQDNCKVSSVPNTELTSSLVKVDVRDAAQNGQELFFGNVGTSSKNFEMPPAVTDFDARFVTNNGNISTAGDQHVVKISSKSYPVALNFGNVVGTVEVRDLTGALLGSVTNGGSVVIRNESVKEVVLSLKNGTSSNVIGYSLNANYPNPFSTVTNINYSIPAETFVSITITNALGQVVATPVSAVVASGAHSTSFDASNLAAGTYFYTIHAGNFLQTEKMTVSK